MSTVTDPIADLLARVRNGAQKPELFVPYSKIKAEIARILKDEGYITDYELDWSAAHPRIKITNKLVNRSCAITGLKRVSRPVCGVMWGRRKFRASSAEWALQSSL